MLKDNILASEIKNINELFAFSSEKFIDLAYEIFLCRKPDDNGMRYYLGRLALGYSKIDVLEQIYRSPECCFCGELDGLNALLRMQRRRRHWFWKWFTTSAPRQSMEFYRDLSLSWADYLYSSSMHKRHEERRISEVLSDQNKLIDRIISTYESNKEKMRQNSSVRTGEKLSDMNNYIPDRIVSISSDSSTDIRNLWRDYGLRIGD